MTTIVGGKKTHSSISVEEMRSSVVSYSKHSMGWIIRYNLQHRTLRPLKVQRRRHAGRAVAGHLNQGASPRLGPCHDCLLSFKTASS